MYTLEFYDEIRDIEYKYNFSNPISPQQALDTITKAYLGLDSVPDASNPLVYSVSQTVNLLPLLAYQKIYYDFFSESQWEKHLAYAYNVDYWDGKSQLNLAPEMIQLRYANYPKDCFMGMLPNSQYGNVAVMPNFYRSDVPSTYVVAAGSGTPAQISNPSTSTTVQTENSSSSNRTVVPNPDLSARSIS